MSDDETKWALPEDVKDDIQRRRDACAATGGHSWSNRFYPIVGPMRICRNCGAAEPWKVIRGTVA